MAHTIEFIFTLCWVSHRIIIIIMIIIFLNFKYKIIIIIYDNFIRDAFQKIISKATSQTEIEIEDILKIII